MPPQNFPTRKSGEILFFYAVMSAFNEIQYKKKQFQPPFSYSISETTSTTSLSQKVLMAVIEMCYLIVACPADE